MSAYAHPSQRDISKLQLRSVRIAELAVSVDSNELLAALGIGSCVAVVVVGQSPAGCVAGIAHALLPSADERSAEDGVVARYADTAVEALIAGLVTQGAWRRTLRAVLAGGASMFATREGVLHVGNRNVTVAERVLRREKIPIVASEVGGTRGRSVRVVVADGTVLVRQAGHADRVVYRAVAAEPAEQSSGKHRSERLRR